MNTSIRILYIAASVVVTGAVSTGHAQGPIDGQVYGRINLSAQVAENSYNGSVSDLVSNASRLGFAGATDLNPDLRVIYQLEYQVNPDNGGSNDRILTQRNSFLGLEGAYGSILAGRHDTPLKLAQEDIDLFNDLRGDISRVFDGENRVNDILLYRSPAWEGFTGSVAAMAGGDNGVNDDFTDSVSASIEYENEGLYMAVAMDEDVNRTDSVRLVASYSFARLDLGAMYQSSEPSAGLAQENSRDDGLFVSAAYNAGDLTWKAQYGESDQKRAGARQWSGGLDYRLGERTKIFGFYTQYEAQDNNLDVDDYGIGLEHRF